jgi:hypothetical protein
MLQLVIPGDDGEYYKQSMQTVQQLPVVYNIVLLAMIECCHGSHGQHKNII